MDHTSTECGPFPPTARAALQAARMLGQQAMTALRFTGFPLVFSSPHFVAGYRAGVAAWRVDFAAGASLPTAPTPQSLTWLCGFWYGYVNAGRVEGVPDAVVIDPAVYAERCPGPGPGVAPRAV